MRLSAREFLGRREFRAVLLPALLVGFGLPATALADSWIDCTGQMVTTKEGKPDQKTEDAHDIYVLDDAAKSLQKYSQTRKLIDPEPVTLYTMDEVKWVKKPSLGVLDPNWDGRLDRKTMALKLDYHVGPETTTWTETCKPTDPQPIDMAASAIQGPPIAPLDPGKPDAKGDAKGAAPGKPAAAPAKAAPAKPTDAKPAATPAAK